MPIEENTLPFSATLSASRLEDVTDMMREISKYSDPADIVREYVQRIRQFYPVDRVIALARPDMNSDEVLYASMGNWDKPVLPWGDLDSFQPLGDGLLKNLCLNGEPTIINNLTDELNESERDLIGNMNSLRVIPLFDKGDATQMIVGLKEEGSGFQEEDLSALVWLGNLFGKAVQNLIKARELESAYQEVDRELKTVGQIQRDLLPETLPEIPNLELATYYEPSARAGGDYYDFFPLQDGRLGIFIADVSGHGTPAAVVMAIMHTIAHTYTGSQELPSQFMTHINKHLCQNFTTRSGIFVTAFYAIYNPQDKSLAYASAGHNPPIHRRCGASPVSTLNRAGRIPLGISTEITYDDATVKLSSGDRVVLYTDGIIEAFGTDDTQFGMDRLGAIVGRCDLNSTTIVDAVVKQLQEFTGTTSQTDDCTLVVMKVR
ncbi:GAF domain-containing SpoIIE family protein phosphatase [Rubinisphaera italica]|uniref:Phosphoserine phosphatase RsbU n=1 Tax=Rubinisphaera italica TaxID=2527969 RepID=A0A5C5XGP0_9PLAN|nr:SpoIIE family protein phosphatase [Rubinisphaera italica]TWT62247.1 Phosphoserine phosphatase RsbU [Rubinisphaera italica]